MKVNLNPEVDVIQLWEQLKKAKTIYNRKNCWRRFANKSINSAHFLNAHCDAKVTIHSSWSYEHDQFSASPLLHLLNNLWVFSRALIKA